MQLVTVC